MLFHILNQFIHHRPSVLLLLIDEPAVSRDLLSILREKRCQGQLKFIDEIIRQEA